MDSRSLSVASIVSLLCLDFIKLALIANIIAAPVSYYLLKRWMETFAYSEGISVGNFVCVALGILLLTVLIISTLAIKIAVRNPVESLRYE